MVSYVRSVLLRYVGICVFALFFVVLLFSGLPGALDTCKCDEQRDRDLQHEQFHKSFRFEQHTDQKRLAIVVPFRDRFDELLQFAPHIATFLKRQGVPFHIFVVNQNDRYRFNRASLINVGFLQVRDTYDYFAMHDVDLLPLNDNLRYEFPEHGPLHISGPEYHPKYHYAAFIGGILLLRMEHFAQLNGMSNRYWGWGLEDDEFYVRIKEAGLEVTRSKNISTGTTDTFLHVHDRVHRRRDTTKCFNQREVTRKRDRETGLSTINYTVHSRRELTIDGVPVTVLNVDLHCNKQQTPWCECEPKPGLAAWYDINVIKDTILKAAESSVKFTKNNGYCALVECCNEVYIQFDVEGLRRDLKKALYGQHIVQEIIVNAIGGHFKNIDTSEKPLVMSFHGLPGTGKNFVAEHIIAALYKKKADSKFVHKYLGRIHFPLVSEVDNYKMILVEDIKQAVAKCPNSLFIFDEVEKMPPGLFDSIVALLDNHAYDKAHDFRKAIFIFLSNVAGPEIAVRLKSLVDKGTWREETKLHDFESTVEIAAYNLDGGLFKSELIEKHVVDHFVPFLPLELRHVEDCIRTEYRKFSNDKMPDELLRAVTKEAVTFDETGLYSNSGWKELVTVVRTLWPVEDRHGAKVFLEALDEFVNVTACELNATVTPVNTRLEDAEEIFLRLEDPTQAKLFDKNGKFLLIALKHQLQESVVLSTNSLSLTVCNKQFRFRIDHVITTNAVNDLTDQLSGMSLTDRMYVILNTTKLTLLDDSKAAQHGHQQRMFHLSNIGGLDSTIIELQELLAMAFGMDTKQSSAGPISRGILLSGVSGVGKTMLVNALATHYQCHVVRLNCSEVFSKFYGESEANVSRQFAEVFDVHPKPAMVIVEELHNLCPKSTGTDIVKRISQHFLNLLDSLHANVRGNRTVVMGTTDNVDNVNPLLRRGGRMDYEFELPVPDAIAREAILQRVLSRHNQTLPQEDVRAVARITHGYVGADLENLVAKAASASSSFPSGKSIDGTALMGALQHVKASAMREIMIECPNVRWTDIGGQDELKLKLRQIIDWPIHHPELFERLGIKPPRGLLMFGPPGCSKTMIAKAIATESRLNFLSIKGSELFSMWVGESERAVRDLFRRARQVAPSIIFFDEIDAIGGERSAESGSSVKERVLAQLLTEMDGVSVLKDVRIVAATNRPDIIDRALMRPGRLDRIVYVRLPDAAAREEIFRIKLKKIPTSPAVDIAELVRRTDGCSGSEIEAICQEAALKGLESSFDVQSIEWAHFEHALEVVRPRTSADLLRLYEEYLKQHQ
uniref:Beta-1,4-galactosyltransferase 7 n=1 Tax=Anopheles epiroticus TaxID=199890 RepID=A0A182PB48_9DIPT